MKKIFTLVIAVIMTAANVSASGFYLNVMGEGKQIIAQISSESLKNWYFRTDNTVIFTTNFGNQLVFDQVVEIKPTVTAVANNATALGWKLNETAVWGGGTYGWIEKGGIVSSFFETIAIIHKQGVCFYNFKTEEDLFYDNEQIAPRTWEPDVYFPDAPSILSLYEELGETLGSITFLYPTGMYFYYPFDINVSLAGINRTNFGFNNNSNVIPTDFVVNADGSVTASFTNYKGEYKEHTFCEWGGSAAGSSSQKNAPALRSSNEDELVQYITVNDLDGNEKAKLSFTTTESISCKYGVVTVVKSNGETFAYTAAEIAPFGFVLAAPGMETGTGMEIITTANGKIYYYSGTLHIESIAGDIKVYSIDGKLITTVPALAGNNREVVLQLKKGLYIAASPNGAFKFLVK